ncbi:TfoX/Sxy family protein [Collinsella sp. HCP28S3_E9]|uniref:TfoX/Sxy family protein n=1 Tax=unclassified Collinsella TaxID=2637548 RepID=UPI003F8A072D
MSSSAEYLNYILDLLHEVPALTHRKMMGEYMLYSDGVLFGGVYDDRFLLKDVPAALEAFPTEQVPYDGAKPMLLVDGDNPTLIAAVVDAMTPQLPLPRKRK